MKVLFIVRGTLYTNKGGDTIQILETARYLKELGVDVAIKSATEEIAYGEYDLLHFFNITRPADILKHIERSKKPFVLSPIFVDYSEFDRAFRKGYSGLLLRCLHINGIEYVKTLARFIFKGEKIVSWKYFIYGQKRSVKKILRQSKLLLPNSYSEYARLEKEYHIEKPYTVIPNAVGDLFLQASRNIPEKDETLVLCVARIEGLKNQLHLIQALNNTRYSLVLIGHAASNQATYYRLCKAAAAANVRFVDHIPQEDLPDYYSRAKVHILPSWFETTGLSSLEAAVLGCNIVITDKGDTREYFQDQAWYCDPASPASILRAVEEAAGSPHDDTLQKKIISEYTWVQAARKTHAAYLELAGK
jgi:glycosyltransferase involved in cell wall biosynthesis